MAVESPVRQYSFARFLNARNATQPRFSPDGRFVAFLADITGVAQAWHVPVDGGWPEQLTFTDDRVMSIHFAHREPVLIYGMDKGGDEREQLYRIAGADEQDIAVDPTVMHTFGAFSPDDRSVAYSDNRRHPAYFDVYIRDLITGEEQCVYQQDGSNYVSDWSADGRSLLINRRTGSLDGELFLLDIASGEATHLTPHEPPVQFEGAEFLPDGQSIVLRTDRDSEFMRLTQMDLTTHEIQFLTPDDVDVDWLRLSPDGRRLAMVRNEEGYGRLSVRDLSNGEEVRVPDLPDGVPMEPEWSPDGRKLAFSFTASAYNLDIWVWNLDAGTCRQITHMTRGGIPPETFVAPEIVRFPSFDGREIPAFLYMPTGVERPPIIVHVHGGPESQALPQFSPIIQYFVHRGYAVLAPNVRGSTGYGRTYTHLDDVEKRMDSVADLEAAAGWLRASGRIDGDRMAVMGGSYGGFMVLAALTTYPDLWTAGVDIVGIADFETFLRNTGAYRRHWRIPEYGDPDRDAELFRRISPIHHVDRIRAPLMVIHGDNDPRVPLSETEQMVQAIKGQGLPVEMMRFADEGHGVVKLKNKLVAYPAIGAFLDRHVRGAEQG